MNRSKRIKLALLRMLRDSLDAGGFPRSTTSLHNDLILVIRPQPPLNETEAALQALSTDRHIIGVGAGDELVWKITNAGRLELVELETA